MTGLPCWLQALAVYGAYVAVVASATTAAMLVWLRRHPTNS